MVWLQEILGGFGWFRIFSGSFGWFHVVLCFSSYPAQVFSCDICRIFKNTYFEENLPKNISEEVCKNLHPLMITENM